jgi:hypothetical protein
MYSTDGQNQPSSGQVQRSGSGRNYLSPSGSSTNLADILERVLDKGVVIAGDITIYLADVQLLSIKIRLLVASVDKAKEMGINWWQSDPALSTRAQRLEEENRALRDRLDRLESRLSPPSATEGQPGTTSSEGA